VTSQTSSFLTSTILSFNSRLRIFEEGTYLYTQIGLAEKQSYAKPFVFFFNQKGKLISSEVAQLVVINNHGNCLGVMDKWIEL
jgi:hypothetical protein